MEIVEPPPLDLDFHQPDNHGEQSAGGLAEDPSENGDDADAESSTISQGGSGPELEFEAESEAEAEAEAEAESESKLERPAKRLQITRDVDEPESELESEPDRPAKLLRTTTTRDVNEDPSNKAGRGGEAPSK